VPDVRPGNYRILVCADGPGSSTSGGHPQAMTCPAVHRLPSSRSSTARRSVTREVASTDRSAQQEQLALVAVSAAVDLFTRIESEVSMTPTRVRLIDIADQSLARARTEAEASEHAGAVVTYRRTVIALGRILRDEFG